MIIRFQSPGASFRGAAMYYTHDKAEDASMDKEFKPKTDERVWFTATRNCVSQDPMEAADEMWHTAESQQYLKKQAGGRTSGRRCDDPVQTISLSWHKDDHPQPDEMIAAADQFLKHMGWQEHQASFVGHRDTEHLHLHIMLNRVHPETGKTLDDYRCQKRAQVWALAYEKEHGQIRCPERELNAAEREKREPELTPEQMRQAKDPANEHIPPNVIELTRPSQKAFTAEEASREERDRQERAQLKQEQREERQAFFKEGAKLFKETRHAVYDEVRAEFKPRWKEHYEAADKAREQAEAMSKDAVTRALYFAKSGRWDDARAALTNAEAVHEDVEKSITAERRELKQERDTQIRERQTEACDLLRAGREKAYEDLLQRQRDERASMKAAHAMGQSGLPDREGEAPQKDTANENRTPAETQAKAPAVAPAPSAEKATTAEPVQATNGERTSDKAPSLAVDFLSDLATDATSTTIHKDHSSRPLDERAPVRTPFDGMAGAMGAVADYVADQLGELFAPTPKEVLDERAREQARREAEAPAPEPVDPYAAHRAAAMRVIEEEAERKRSNEYFEERNRSKGWERDR